LEVRVIFDIARLQLPLSIKKHLQLPIRTLSAIRCLRLRRLEHVRQQLLLGIQCQRRRIPRIKIIRLGWGPLGLHRALRRSPLLLRVPIREILRLRLPIKPLPCPRTY
jgi:hypothetical protein